MKRSRSWSRNRGFAIAAVASTALAGGLSQVVDSRQAAAADPPAATGASLNFPRATTVAGKVRKPITGRLSKAGYRVLALSAGGRASSLVVRGKQFTLRPPAGTVTLHLQAPNGRYAGPILMERNGREATLGVRSGVGLGRVKIRHGYATLEHKLAKQSVVSDFGARAHNGVPIGAGRIGLVRTKLPRRGGPGDRDLDGIANVFDVDDDGDLVLDGYDRSTKRSVATAYAAPATQASAFPDGSSLHLATGLGWTPYGYVNADGGSTPDQLDAVLRDGGTLAVQWDSIDQDSGELDCGTLGYCSAGGTGLWRETNTPPDPGDQRTGRPAFPDCCDGDDDGLGSLMPDQPSGGPNGGMFLLHGATAQEIRADDVLIARGTSDGVPVEYPASVGFVFASDPVIASYDDGQGNRGTFSYPAAPECLEGSVYGGSGPSKPQCSPRVHTDTNGDLVLRLEIWRPQRMRLPTEPGSTRWIDVGNLAYAISLPVGAGAGGYCPTSTYTAEPRLSPLTTDINRTVPAGSAVVDRSPDEPASPANTLSVTLNLTSCYRALGAAPTAAPLIQIWSYALGSTYPVSGPASDAHSQQSFTVVP
ncbi:MAG: hypothetical protein V9E98_15065 [Candidatus Nanopelagicales bacterium]